MTKFEETMRSIEQQHQTMKKILSAMALALSAAALCAIMQPEKPVYLDESLPVEQRIEDALSRMTLREKIAVIHAQSKFSSAGVPRLGIPEIWTTDGPHGIRPEVLWDEWRQAEWTTDSCTAFPALTCLAATWNPEMALLYGHAIGEEARYRKKDVLLGPGVNICRTPLNGRNFEYMGEDPYLASAMVVPYVQGVQQNGVAACVKHFALNNQESDRNTTNVVVDDRTLYEIYLPAFKAAVTEGGAWAIMGSYNLYGNQYACHNEVLLNKILKGEWGFDGVVISDWGGTHDTRQAIANGLDMEFGSWTDGMAYGASNAYDNYYMAAPYLQMIERGEIGTDELDDKVRRVLRLAFRTVMNRNRPFGKFCSEEHSAAARRIGEEGVVLLQNRGNQLPIEPSKVKRIAVIGENAIKKMTVGGGSSSLKAKYEVTPLEGIRNRLGEEVEVIYARGYVGDTLSEYDGVTTGIDLSDNRTPEQLVDEALDAAREADCVIFIGGLNKSVNQDCEGADRLALELPYGQNELIERLAAVNNHLTVVNISGGAAAMRWAPVVPSILQLWYLGSETGNILASVLFGDTNPSGKLPVTFPASLDDTGAHKIGQYPGVPRNDGSGIVDERYDEGIFVGYRYADYAGVQPLFPFGHGLSYTQFSYGRPQLDKRTLRGDEVLRVTVPVTNTGNRAGSEVVQMYIRDVKSSVVRPVKELKGFCKLHLEAGETKEAVFDIDKTALCYFDDARYEWVAEPGKFEVVIAASATDIRATEKFDYRTDN